MALHHISRGSSTANSMSVISQLLLTPFWPNFKGRFIEPFSSITVTFVLVSLTLFPMGVVVGMGPLWRNFFPCFFPPTPPPSQVLVSFALNTFIKMSLCPFYIFLFLIWFSFGDRSHISSIDVRIILNWYNQELIGFNSIFLLMNTAICDFFYFSYFEKFIAKLCLKWIKYGLWWKIGDLKICFGVVNRAREWFFVAGGSFWWQRMVGWLNINLTFGWPQSRAILFWNKIFFGPKFNLTKEFWPKNFFQKTISDPTNKTLDQIPHISAWYDLT